MRKAIMKNKYREHILAVGIISLILISGVTIAGAVAGDLDTSFGIGGKVMTDFGNVININQINAIALLSNGKIVVTGTTYKDLTDFALAQYNTDGSLDTNFGTGGKVITDFGPGNDDKAYASGIQSDGKIVVAGNTLYVTGYTDFAIARYNHDGSLDTNFGTGGKVTTDFGSSSDDAYALAIQSDGKIVVAGSTDKIGNTDFAIARYNIDGSLDTTFGTEGRVITDIGSTNDIAASLALQPDGKIVVAGRTIGSNSDFALARYNIGGSLDTTFGTEGKVITDFGINSGAASLALQSDGKIVVAGVAGTDFALARYNTNGVLDTAFGNSGKVITDFGSNFDRATSLALQSNGKIVVAGRTIGSNSDFALARYDTNGVLDTTTFGNGGKVITDFGGNFDIATSMAMQSDGKIVAAGLTQSSTGVDFALARYIGDTIVIDNNPPIVSNVRASPNPSEVDKDITLTATVSDAITGNSKISSAEYNIDNGPFFAMNAQDGSFDEVSEDVTKDIGSFSEAGVHQVCVRGTDEANNIGTSECILLAIYDPTAGFVTGGGWINSPLGAYIENPTLTGKANFGFVSKYKKGADSPIGETEFQFKVANLDFHSDTYEWLVVAGARAQYKGIGKINGAGNYGFMLTAIDGQRPGGGGIDKFRIKIWNNDAQQGTDGIVYDNQLSTSDTANPVTVLGGGNIVIQTN